MESVLGAFLCVVCINFTNDRKLTAHTVYLCISVLVFAPGLVPVRPAGALPALPLPLHRDADVRHLHRQQNHVPVGGEGAAAPRL